MDADAESNGEEHDTYPENGNCHECGETDRRPQHDENEDFRGEGHPVPAHVVSDVSAEEPVVKDPVVDPVRAPREKEGRENQKWGSRKDRDKYAKDSEPERERAACEEEDPRCTAVSFPVLIHVF